MIVAAEAIESGAALMAFLILSSLVDGATVGPGPAGFVDAVVVAATVSLAGAAPLLHATRLVSETTTVSGRAMRITPSDWGR
jgi:hypothetical protein